MSEHDSAASGDVEPSDTFDDDVVDGEVVDAEIVDDDGVAAEANGPSTEPDTNGSGEAVDTGDDGTDAVERERDEYLDSLRRLQADFENFKKRSNRQLAETLERSGEQLVLKLLPVIDAVDLAQQHGAGEGVQQIATALFEVLTKEGLERVGAADDVFDPNLHEAVAHEEGDGGEAVLSEVMRAGWSWKGRLLRPAMVKVRG
ncbi:MAG: nucleotide exchange factor GrpE [Acidimicrobiales bacterium]